MLHYCTYPSVKESIEDTLNGRPIQKLPLKADQSDCYRLLSQLATATGFPLVATLDVQHCLAKSSNALQRLTKLLKKQSGKAVSVVLCSQKTMSSSIVKTVAMATSTPAAARLAVASSSTSSVILKRQLAKVASCFLFSSQLKGHRKHFRLEVCKTDMWDFGR